MSEMLPLRATRLSSCWTRHQNNDSVYSSLSQAPRHTMSDDELMSTHSLGDYPRSPDAAELEEEDRYEVFMPAVQNLVNAMGGYERQPGPGENEWTTIYRPGDSVLPVLKDLKKLWRKDDSDDERTVARCMYQANLMNELIGLVNEVTDRGEWGRKVALMACELIALDDCNSDIR